MLVCAVDMLPDGGTRSSLLTVAGVCHQTMSCHQHVPAACHLPSAHKGGKPSGSGMHRCPATCLGTCQQTAACCRHIPRASQLLLVPAGNLLPFSHTCQPPAIGCRCALVATCDCGWCELVYCCLTVACADYPPPVATVHWQPATTYQCGLATCSLMSACTSGMPPVTSMCWQTATCWRHEPVDCLLSLVRAIGQPSVSGTCQWPVT